MIILPENLSHRDFLLDGSPIRGEAALATFAALDWSRAWVDFGPSPAGNPGPYFHVPVGRGDDEVTHRLYPRIVTGKWGALIRILCAEYHSAKTKRPSRQEVSAWKL